MTDPIDDQPIHGVQRDDEPFDPLTELAEKITGQLLDDPAYADVKCIVFLEDSQRSGIKMSGYDDPIAGMAALFVHMKAMFNSVGRDLEFVGIPEDTSGLDP